MASSPEARAKMHELLAALSDLEVRELCIEALRKEHAAHPSEPTLGLNAMARHLVPLLVQRAGKEGDSDVRLLVASGHLPETFVDDAFSQTQSFAAVREFVVWFARAGLAWPRTAHPYTYPMGLFLTRAGIRFLQSKDDHPLLPGFVDRLAKRCPNLPDDVISLLLDARTCLDQGLMRPAIVLMGVAYEVAIEHVVTILASKSLLPATLVEASAAKCITEIDKLVDGLFPGPAKKDDRDAVRGAYAFAHLLRRRRNDAAHTKPTYGFEDRKEVEELIVSAGRHLPNLWRVH